MKRLLVLLCGLAVSVTNVGQAGYGTWDKTVVEVAGQTKGFETLLAAVKAADLVKTLSGKGPFTVFAPTDEAFAKLPKGTLEELLKPENKERLAGNLTYHVVPQEVLSKEVVTLKDAMTAQGSKVKIAVKDGAVMIYDAKVVKTDIPCKKGVVHTVILPKKETERS